MLFGLPGFPAETNSNRRDPPETRFGQLTIFANQLMRERALYRHTPNTQRQFNCYFLIVPGEGDVEGGLTDSRTPTRSHAVLQFG